MYEKSCNYKTSYRCIDLGQPILQSTPLSFVNMKIVIALSQRTSCGERVGSGVGRDSASAQLHITNLLGTSVPRPILLH